MNTIRARHALFFAVFFACISSPQAIAQSSTKPQDDVAAQLEALQAAVEQLKQTVSEQQNQIDTLKQENVQLHDEVGTATASPPPPSLPAGSASGVAQSSLPEISALVDVVGTLSEDSGDDEGNDRLSVRELELTIGSDVDPYTRFDSTISFSDFEDVSVEEAYLTYLGLPHELSLRAGRFHPRIGKAAVLHRDQLDTVDEPLVVQRYLGVEGFSKTGVEFGHYLPVFAGPLTQELTIGVVEGGSGEGGAMFGETRRRPTYYAHLKNYVELSDLSNIEIGGTYLLGSSDPDGRNEVNALGLDFTLEHHFTQTHKLKLQSELYYMSRKETRVLNKDAALSYYDAASEDIGTGVDNFFALLGGELPSVGPPAILDAIEANAFFTRYNSNPWGMYALVDYRLSPRFGAGVRFDYVEPVFKTAWRERRAETGFSAYVTFYQSEFSRMRFQYEHNSPVFGDDTNTFFLQADYAVGVHKHKLN